MTSVRSARAVAHSNIAFAKYWGKADAPLNLPAVPSVSMTLDGLITETSVRFDEQLRSDQVRLDGRRASAGARDRVVELLDRVRDEADLSLFARVQSENSFPTASGLASSASGFAALAAAASVAAGLPYRPKQISRLARASSASAARSVFGGFVALPKGKPGDARLAARQLFDARHWDVRLVVAVTTEAQKPIGSTAGMERSRRTSPLYASWLDSAPRLSRTIVRALRDRDLDRLGAAMEQSTFAFHACAMTSAPAVVYFQPATMAAYGEVRRLRDRGVSVWATMDAGPHVKALCHADDATRVRRALGRVEGVLRTLVTAPGPDLEVSA